MADSYNDLTPYLQAAGAKITPSQTASSLFTQNNNAAIDKQAQDMRQSNFIMSHPWASSLIGALALGGLGLAAGKHSSMGSASALLGALAPLAVMSYNNNRRDAINSGALRAKSKIPDKIKLMQDNLGQGATADNENALHPGLNLAPFTPAPQAENLGKAAIAGDSFEEFKRTLEDAQARGATPFSTEGSISGASMNNALNGGRPVLSGGVSAMGNLPPMQPPGERPQYLINPENLNTFMTNYTGRLNNSANIQAEAPLKAAQIRKSDSETKLNQIDAQTRDKLNRALEWQRLHPGSGSGQNSINGLSTMAGILQKGIENTLNQMKQMGFVDQHGTFVPPSATEGGFLGMGAHANPKVQQYNSMVRQLKMQQQQLNTLTGGGNGSPAPAPAPGNGKPQVVNGIPI